MKPLWKGPVTQLYIGFGPSSERLFMSGKKTKNRSVRWFLAFSF